MSEARFTEEYFTARDGERLFHLALEPADPRAVVVVVHGYGDHAGRYRHVMEFFASKGLAAHALDYRGHGRAGGKRAYVERFELYCRDIADFVARVKARHPGSPVFLVGHSNGALASLSMVLSSERPDGLAGVVISAPYLRLAIQPSFFQLLQAKVGNKLAPSLAIKSPLSPDMLTNDRAMVEATINDPLYLRVVTARWYNEAMAAQTEVLDRAGSFDLPLLVLVPEGDAVAHPKGARDFFEAAGSADKKLLSYPGLFHELFNETERQKVLDDVMTWLEPRLSGRTEAA